MHALEAAAGKIGQPVRELLANTSLVSHGTTVGTNAIVQKRGARVGLVTTPRAQRRHPHHAGLARARRPRSAPGGAHPGKPEAEPGRAEAPHSRRLRARGLLRAGRRAPQRGAGRGVHSRAARRGRAGDRDLLPVVVPRARARAPGQGHRPGPRPGPLRHLLPRARAQVGRVRANHRLVPQRLRGAGHHELPRGHRGAARAGGIRRPAPDHPGRGRHHPRRGRAPLAAPHPRLGAGRGGDGLAALGRGDGLRERHHHRHGRHLVRHRGHPRRRARLLVPEQGAPVRVLPAEGGHPGDRERGREHGPDRRGDGHPPGRPGERRGRARPGLLRPGAATCPR